MKRSLIIALLISILSTLTAFAYNFVWQQDDIGWKYVNTTTNNPLKYGMVVETGNGTFQFVRTNNAQKVTPFEDGTNIVATYFIKDGYMVTNSWMPFLDSDGSGNWRYYGADGKALTNTTTPDGYTVDAQGFWTENGVKVRDAAAAAQFNQELYGKNFNSSGIQATENRENAEPSNQSSSGKISDPLTNDLFGYCYAVNSVNGVKVSWKAKNLSGKTIDHYNLYFYVRNSGGEFINEQITGIPLTRIRYAGTVRPGEELICFSVIGYFSGAKEVCLYKIELEYSDGTEEMIEYNKATRKHNSSIL